MSTPPLSRTALAALRMMLLRSRRVSAGRAMQKSSYSGMAAHSYYWSVQARRQL